MTFAKLKNSIRVLLIGDNVLPNKDDLVIAALEMAFLELANKVTALKLLTANKDNQIIRQGPGGSFIRMPKLPRDDTEELDIDHELVPAVARIMASYVSKDKGSKHQREAQKVINDYEGKVEAYMRTQESRGRYEDA